jgi:trk system potassium uptake protein TrkH
MMPTRTWINRWEVAQRRRASFWRGLTAAQLFVGSFAFLILIGTLGLKALPGLYTGAPLGWLDALFTATSAVCVTGLIVVDTATYFTTAGQAWILFLIQVGGLGIITFTTVIILALGRRLSLRHEVLTTGTTDPAPHVDHRALARNIIRFTLLFEAAGAVILYAVWGGSLGWSSAAWHAVFHSVSAFCNAGFSTFSDSLIAFRLSPVTLVTVMALIVVGGLGFLTLEELHLRRRSLRSGARFRLSVHSRIVLVATAVLLLGAWVLFTVLEWQVTLADMPVWARPFNSLFMSVTARTAGFNTVDYDAASGGSNFITILLMSIGGSPGSAAGGLKTTTFVLIGLLAWSRFRGRDVVSVWGRTVPEETVQRAVGLFAVAFGVVTIAILGYVALEMGAQVHSGPGHGFLSYMFEAASAFNTVGLSMGVTPQLSDASRWLTIALMFMGRVGPLTFAAAIALARPTPAGGFRFAYEDVVVG